MGEFYSSSMDKTKKPHNLRIWQILCVVFAVIALALLIALIVVTTTEDDEVESCPSASTKTSAQTLSPGKAAIFNDLTPAELKAVRDYMLKKSAYNIKPFSKATVNSNYIFLIELHVPRKDEVLDYLDHNKAKPTRKARVIVHAGAGNLPRVDEYIVYPADKPTKDEKKAYNTLNGSPIPFTSRAQNAIEMKALDALIKKELKKAEGILKKRYNGFFYTDCSDKCLWYAVSAPRDTTQSNERKAWVWFTYSLPGNIMHPIDFEIWVDFSGTDTSSWKIEKVLCQYVEYGSIDIFVTSFSGTSIGEFPLPANWDNDEKIFSSLYPKGSPPVYFSSVEPGPQMYMPAGNRFRVNGRHIEYMDWSMDIRHRSSSGMQIFNINFRKERIIYELSLQEAAALYSAKSGAREKGNYMDSAYGLGVSHHEMVVGSDCPSSAAFLDTVTLVDSHDPKVTKNAICIFEWNTGIPLRRHIEKSGGDGKTFYGAMENNVLIVRSIATVYNYDYIFDYIFYQSGMVEVKVSATGYLLTTYYSDKEEAYSFEVHKDVAGTIHDHFVHFKVDLDVAGRNNTVEKIEVQTEQVGDWLGNSVEKKKMVSRVVQLEETSKITKDDLFKPMYINVFNKEAKNAMGVNKGYRIQLGSPIFKSYLYNTDIDKMIPWAKYLIATTLYKDGERRSSSIYNQNSAQNPVVNFDNYILDNEQIDYKDVVNWVTLRMLHIPSSEDVPLTVTQPNYIHFFIRPFNYFDIDPSMNSRNVVVIKPGDGEPKVQNFEKEQDTCVPEKKEIKYSGF